MTITEEFFNEFLMSIVDPDDWENDVFPTLYGRVNLLGQDLPWMPLLDHEDPYELFTPFVQAGFTQSMEAIVVMYGWMTRIDGEDDDDGDSRMRVRVMLYFNGTDLQVAVQPQGKTVWLPDDEGEGMVPDMLHQLISEGKKEFLGQ